MIRTIRVRVSRGDHQFVATGLDLPAGTQASTLDQLTENIREVIGLHLEGEDLESLWFTAIPVILAARELEAISGCRACASCQSPKEYGFCECSVFSRRPNAEAMSQFAG